MSFVSENSVAVDNTRDLYSRYGDQYPYGADAIAYYIFGDKSDDNILLRSYKGVHGKGAEVEPSQVSEYMISYEYSWECNIEEIDNFIRNLPTADGRCLSECF